MDGGIRRGADIVKAICLGARAVLCGRAYAYGLAVSGGAGVMQALEILRADVERTLRLLGCASIAALDRSLVSRLNAGRKTHLPERTVSPASEKRIASLQFENASHTNCLPDNSWNTCARQDQAV